MSDYDPHYVQEKNFYLLAAKVVILNSKNEVLLLRRSKLSPLPGILDLPGGIVDKEDESPEAAAIRETFEEAGIVITNAKIIDSQFTQGRKDNWVILGFVTHVETPEVTLSWEHDEYTWTPVGEVAHTNLPDHYKYMVTKAL